MGRLKPRVRLVAVGTEGEVNLGFMARLAKNFEVDEFYLVSPRVGIGETARRYAAHAVDVLDKIVIVESLDEALRGVDIAACTSARAGQKTDVLRHPLLPWEFAELAKKVDSVAVVFGRESTGLTRDEIGKCEVLVTIPANPEYPVLNLSHAVAIILYELYKVRGGGHVERVKPSDVHIHVLARRIECIASRVVEPQRVQQVAAAAKHLLAKALLTSGEVSALNYLFKRIAVALGARECLE